MAVKWVIQVLVITLVYRYMYADTATESESFTASLPVCPGDIATFICTVCNTTSSAATYWQVGGYTCLVLHSGIVKTNRCGPNRSFVAELKTDGGNCYRSVFNITAHLNLNGATVRCSVEQGNRTVGHGNMEVIGTPPPPNFHPLYPGDIARVQGSNEVALSLSWSVPDRYRYIENITRYVITARSLAPQYRRTWEIDSGTTQISVRVPVDRVIEFTVRAEACGEGRESSPVVVRTKVPDALPHCNTTAVYDSSSNKLTEIIIRWPRSVVPSFEIAPGLSAKTRSYSIVVNGQIVEQKQLCSGRWCTYSWKVTDRGPTDYTVSMAANNVVGQGEAVVCRPVPVACNLSDLVESHALSKLTNRTCHIDGELTGLILELPNRELEVCYNGTTPWSVARYSCSGGYVLSEDAVNPRMCGVDGRWDGSEISCDLAPTQALGWCALVAIPLLFPVGVGICVYFCCKNRDGRGRKDGAGDQRRTHEEAGNGQRSEEIFKDGPKSIQDLTLVPKGNPRYRTTRKANGGGRRQRNGKAKW